MTKATPVVGATTPVSTTTRDSAVGTLLAQAAKAQGTMLAKTREAAHLASAQLDNAKPLKERIASVVSAYAADFKTAGHNIKSIFVDAITLLACADTDVAVRVPAKVGMQDTFVKASEAVELSKHNLKDAAKQVRDAHGMGRKAGAGAKPKTATATRAPSAPDMLHVDAFSNWLDMLPEFVNDSIYHGKIVAALIGEGYSLNKAAKGKVVKGAAS
tara:strand:- start:200 stop:844 length:645 start_codon:yes stop_codon:yes gene_type:complete